MASISADREPCHGETLEAVQREDVHPSQVRQCLAASVLGESSRQEVLFAAYPSVVGLDELVGPMEEVDLVVVVVGPSGAQPSGVEPSGAEPSGAEPSGAEPSGAEPFVEVEQVVAGLMEGVDLAEVGLEEVPLPEDLFEEMRPDPVVDILVVEMRCLEHLA